MQKVSYKFNKSTADIYRFRAEGAPYWAEVMIDSAPGSKSGRIFVASDFGSWNYAWGACGESFKKFLAGVDKGYLAKNFGADKFFDAAATIEAFKNQAKEQYTEKSAQYRNMMEVINTLERHCYLKEDFMHYLQGECKSIMRMYDGAPDIVYSLDPGFKNFWEEIWPLLLFEFTREEVLDLYNPRRDGMIDQAVLATNFKGPLTLDYLKDDDNSGKIFAHGIASDPMLHTDPVRWVAKIGGANDWAIYYHKEGESLSFVQAAGMKMHLGVAIRHLVPCTDEAYACYRG